jgi:CRISPR/Cas system-associated protein Cas10 (large subunit of type III CRISPR-Cas system)
MLVTNKHKQSKGNDSKKEATRRIRYSAIESPTRNNPKRHNQKLCPVCGEAIEKTASGGRRKHSCSRCGATLNKQLTCASCDTSRVWQGKRGVACRGCGAEYRGAAR